MWGWKAVEGIIENDVSWEQAKQTVKDFGFREHIVNEQHIVFKKPGRLFYINGRHSALELSLAKRKNGVFMQLRYDTFILFDIGDLQKFADEIARKIGGIEETSPLTKVYHYTTT